MTSGNATKTFDWTDPLDLASRLTDEERMIADVARAYARDKLLPRIVSAFADERFDREIMTEMGALGLLGVTLPEEYGGAGASHVAYGLVAREVEAIDSGYRSALSVQSSLAMYPIYAFGTDEQKRRFLPKMATGELIGCFGLTEADGGSDPAAMRTKAEKVDGGYKLNGSKYWITNSPAADLAIVWAKLDGDINGFIVERGFKGVLDGEDWRQAEFARLADRRHRSRRRLCPGGKSPAEGPRSARPILLPQQGALRDRLGIRRRGGILLPCHARLHGGAIFVRQTACGAAARAEEACRHDD